MVQAWNGASWALTGGRGGDYNGREKKGWRGRKDMGITDFKEKASHGDVLMPIQRYRCFVPFSYQDLSLHWHDEAEVAWIADGEIDYDINFETFRVVKGDILLISPAYAAFSACAQGGGDDFGESGFSSGYAGISDAGRVYD